MDKKLTRRSLREIPSVEKVTVALGDCGVPRPVVVAMVRREISVIRAEKPVPEFSTVVDRSRAAVHRLRLSKIQPVINGTGIIIHTNFGRAPLGPAVAESIGAIAQSYSNLEYDLQTGERGHRAGYLEQNLALLCGAEAATVVNNCAAALVLILRHFTARKKEVAISRGELIQIGGGFRIPDILEASGATLREVGTTNKTTIADYARAIGRDTAMILKVHRSNFFMDGFVASPTTAELGALARKKRKPFVEDLGSGAIVATESFGLSEHEPSASETLHAGADLVCFSGDKLFGGSQAGIIAGKKRFIGALKREPLLRALRCDKLILTALQATTELHLTKKFGEIPILKFLNVSMEDLQRRAEKTAARLCDLGIDARTERTQAQIGGGALPRAQVESVAMAIRSNDFSADQIAERLRHGSPAVVGYVAKNSFMLDLRTIFPKQDEQLVQAVREALR